MTRDRQRNRKGELLCTDCEGDGTISIIEGGLNDPNARVRAEACKGTGVARCEAAKCGKPATVEGADGLFVYCSVAHAYEDENWSSCIVCRAAPQDPAYAPFCGQAHEDAMLGQIAQTKKARLLARAPSACVQCGTELVDPLYAPACSSACRTAWDIAQRRASAPAPLIERAP